MLSEEVWLRCGSYGEKLFLGEGSGAKQRSGTASEVCWERRGLRRKAEFLAECTVRVVLSGEEAGSQQSEVRGGT